MPKPEWVNTCSFVERLQESNLIHLCALGGEVGKKGGEDAECGKKRADVVHEGDARVVGKLAQQCGADTA